MFTEVCAGLRRFEFTEANDWIEANPETYVDGFRNGFVPTDPDAVEEIDPDVLRDLVSDESRQTRRDDASTHHERHILDHLESKRRLSEQAETYYSTGTWRETAPLTDKELQLAELFDEGVDGTPVKQSKPRWGGVGHVPANVGVQVQPGRYALRRRRSTQDNERVFAAWCFDQEAVVGSRRIETSTPPTISFLADSPK